MLILFDISPRMSVVLQQEATFSFPSPGGIEELLQTGKQHHSLEKNVVNVLP